MLKENSGKKLLLSSEKRYDLQVLKSLRRLIRYVDLYSSSLISQYQITVPQLLCLLEINDNQHLTTSRLAKKVYLSASTIVGIIDRLVNKKLVRRNRDIKDRRIVNISITSKGKKVAQNTPTLLQDNLSKFLAALPTTEQATIAHSLKRVVDLMETEQLEENNLSKSNNEPSGDSD